jgi:hypothetical protein
MRLDGTAMPKRIWLFQLPDGHWETRFERPEVPATEYQFVEQATDWIPHRYASDAEGKL